MIEFLSGRRSGADTVVNVTTVGFRFGAVLLVEKLVFSETYEKIGVAGSHFGTHGHTIDLFIINVGEWKQFNVNTISARRSSVSELGSLTMCKSKKKMYEG